ncbi:MAG: Mur ligase family protein [Bacillota bacterium]|nr:Mur ligase family protein [Bacillota bacterium]
MLITGIIGCSSKENTANIINSILSQNGEKISIIELKELAELGEKRVKSYLNELDKNETDILIIKIGITDMDKYILEYLDFDVMIYNDKADDLKGINIDEYTDLMRSIFARLGEKGTAIVNADSGELIQFIQGMKRYVVSYGFNPKASITASSTGDILSENGFLCCLQRTISAKNGKLMEPQEYKINIENNKSDVYNLLAAATFAIVNGIDLNSV